MKSISTPVRWLAMQVRRTAAVLLLTSVAGIGIAANGSAALIAYDGFDYGPVGSDVAGNSGGGSFGFSSA